MRRGERGISQRCQVQKTGRSNWVKVSEGVGLLFRVKWWIYILSMYWSWMNQRRHWLSNASSSRDGEGPTALRKEEHLILLHGIKQYLPSREVAILFRMFS